MGNDGAGMSGALLHEGRPYSENDVMNKAMAGSGVVSTGHQRWCHYDGHLGEHGGLAWRKVLSDY